MLDPRTVLWGQTIAYTLYVLAIMSVMAWFAYRVTRAENTGGVRPGFFYAWVAFLIVLGVSLHLLTAFTIPWKEMDYNRANIPAEKTFNINVAQHKFQLPSRQMTMRVGQVVKFVATSSDLTYGFGVFRPDDTMVFQMQVVPGHANEILWQFSRPGLYTVKSTEYSGPEGVNMAEKNAILVTP